MRFLQRMNDGQPNNGGDDEPGSSQALLDARTQEETLLAAGDEAIRRALGNSDSEAFLRASRQTGGQ
jgi:hypothetical protein